MNNINVTVCVKQLNNKNIGVEQHQMAGIGWFLYLGITITNFMMLLVKTKQVNLIQTSKMWRDEPEKKWFIYQTNARLQVLEF